MKKGLLKKVLSIAVIGVISFSLAACTNKKQAGLDKIKSSGKLVLGTSADYPPYEFHKNIDGKDTIIGFDIAIAEEMAKDLGVELEVKDMDFDGLLAALNTGNVDIVMAGMTPDETRKKKADFSKIYYNAVQEIIVRTEDSDKFKSLEDFNGKKIGVQKGSIQQKMAESQLKGAEIKGLSKVTDLVLELKNKKVDAIVVEKPVAEAYIKKNADMTLASSKLKEESEGGSAVALSKNSGELLESVNKTLDRLIKDNSITNFVVKYNDLMEE
ncbi:transporter substrate-binding domain-containing protein [Clostridium sp. MSJ-4]|uniref:Transporter substrate-binding domain-containing protein n=1 Tax=Clostridium simiarum TaxID=2841506 RepID=A0ABS6F4J7_9CLOT|nr:MULTISPECIES: transporter substrate-binding domain-containing protein [Clostridium]MBU5593442.1 transporter substrate-binding domain-containing protein [Clostridium simiarum]